MFGYRGVSFEYTYPTTIPELMIVGSYSLLSSFRRLESKLGHLSNDVHRTMKA